MLQKVEHIFVSVFYFTALKIIDVNMKVYVTV
jgi:hypothetical protein